MNSVSVIIPTYNSPYLLDAIDSVFQQTHGACEIIVVDSSPDMTLKQIEKYRDRINYLHQPPRGVSAARNLGILNSQSEFIALLDADDFWLPKKLEMQIKAFSEYPDAVFCFSTIWNLYQDDDRDVVPEPYIPVALARWLQSFGSDRNYVFGSVYDMLLQTNCVATSSVVIRKNGLDKIGLFDESFKTGEDYEFWLRLAKHGAVAFITQPTSRYRIHGAGLSGSWADRTVPFFEANLRVLQKHFGMYPSYRVRRAISQTKAQFAANQIKSRHSAEAKRLALESLKAWPNRSAAKVFLEAACPRFYSFATRVVQ